MGSQRVTVLLIFYLVSDTHQLVLLYKLNVMVTNNIRPKECDVPGTGKKKKKTDQKQITNF